jgi:hypothetical protein
MFRTRPKLRGIILHDTPTFDRAIRKAWDTFQSAPGVQWTVLDTPYGQWFQNVSNSIPVHFNLVTAELLVNGVPLTHLPREYTEHNRYKDLFGNLFVGSRPTNERGMMFSS